MKHLQDRVTSARYLIKQAQAKLLEQAKNIPHFASSQIMPQQQGLQSNSGVGPNMVQSQNGPNNSLSASTVNNYQVPDINDKLRKLGTMSATATPQSVRHNQQAPPHTLLILPILGQEIKSPIAL